MIRAIWIITAATVVAAICSLALAFTDKCTRSAIIKAERADFLAGLVSVLPSHDNAPDHDFIDRKGVRVYPAKMSGDIVGYAVSFASEKGYGGHISVLVGVDAGGKISGVSILKHTETPGLGDKISKEPFLSSFKGLSSLRDIHIKKDGGKIDQFSGASMSPRAVSEAVRNAVSFLNENFMSEGMDDNKELN